jgi:hypothetical protein
MHDTLAYFSRDSVYRKHHQDQLTFAMIYEHSERFVMPLSHDEVVHGKRSLLSRMPGDEWQRFANLRCLLAYQYTRPGKKLLFMGTELAPDAEWNALGELDLRLAQHPLRSGFGRFLVRLGELYREHPCLWRSDVSPDGFAWIDCADREQSVLAYLRRFFGDELAVVLNLTPVPRPYYRIGVPHGGTWIPLLCSDAPGSAGRTLRCSAGRAGLRAHGHRVDRIDPSSAHALVLEAANEPATPAARARREAGIEDGYRSALSARWVATRDTTREALALAMGFEAASESSARASLARLRELGRERIPRGPERGSPCAPMRPWADAVRSGSGPTSIPSAHPTTSAAGTSRVTSERTREAGSGRRCVRRHEPAARDHAPRWPVLSTPR